MNPKHPHTTHTDAALQEMGLVSLADVMKALPPAEEMHAQDLAKWHKDAEKIAHRLPKADLRCGKPNCARHAKTFYFTPSDGMPDTRIATRCNRHTLPGYYIDRARLERDPLDWLIHLDRGHVPSSPRLVTYLRNRGAA